MAVDIPADIKASLKKLATSTKTEPKEIMRQLKDIMDNDPQVKGMASEEHKLRFAHILLVRRYTLTGGAKQMYLRPLSKPRARLITSKGQEKYVGNLAAIVKFIEKDKDGNEKLSEPFYAAGTLWENAAEVATTIEPTKVYRTALKVFEDKKRGLELGGNDASFIEASEVKMPTAKEYFESKIKPDIDSLLTPLDDLKINVADDQTDIRIVKGIVLESTVGKSDKMGEYGLYSITDDSYIGKDNFPMWVHPDNVLYGASSELYFIGTATYDEKNEASRFECHFVQPAGFTINKNEEPKPVDQKETEVVDIDDIADELDEESKEESTEDTDKEIANEPDDEFAL